MQSPLGGKTRWGPVHIKVTGPRSWTVSKEKTECIARFWNH